MTEHEAVVGKDLLDRTLELAGADMILIGGQALAFWSSYYRLPMPTIAITKDIDFLGTREDVSRIARGLEGQAVFPGRKNAFTQLVGQVRKELSKDEYINVDVLKGVYGKEDSAALAARSVVASIAAGPFRVLHPVDMLQGRLDNTYKLQEKQDAHGLAQLSPAIEVVRAFLGDIAAHPLAGGQAPTRPLVLRHIGRIESMALSDAGRKIAIRFGIHVADAIDPAPVRHLKGFTVRKLPQLLELMSAARRLQVS